MQIEPVFTVPIRLIEALAWEAGLTPEANVAPHQVSVQNLADAANSLGMHGVSFKNSLQARQDVMQIIANLK